MQALEPMDALGADDLPQDTVSDRLSTGLRLFL